MKLRFIGCGAADYDWSRYGEKGILGSTATLLNGSVLLDCGPTVAKALKRFGIDSSQITGIVNTHSHSDHFSVDVIKEIAQDRKIHFYGSRQSCEQLKDICKVHPVSCGDSFELNGCTFLTLPANHAVTDLKEETFNYLITEDKTLLYALDTAWMLTKARLLIGKTHIDAIVWDATMSEADNWRIFEHSDPEMFSAIRRVLIQTGNVTEDVPVYFDHRARTLWPPELSEQQKIAERYGAHLAIDGETVTI